MFLYHVEQDVERIYKRKDNEQIFLRVDDTNRLLDRDAVRSLEYNRQIRKFEDEIVSDFDFNDIDLPILKRYKEVLNYNEDVLELLTKRHLAIKNNGEYKIKKAGVLLFAKDPEKRTERYARNPRVARALEDMGFVRQLNEGVSKIYKSMEKSMLSEPEYKVQNGNVYLILRNKISQHTKTIPESILLVIQNKWSSLNETQKRILQHLFYNNTSTISDFIDVTGINEKTIRLYLNQFVEQEKILVRLSNKIRDKNALYAFKRTAHDIKEH